MSSTLARLRAAGTALGVVIAIAVALFLVIAIAALGVGYIWGTVFTNDNGPDPPTVEFDTALEDGTLTIEHDGGDTLDPADVVITIDGTDRGTWAEYGGSGTVSEGSSIDVDGVESGDEIEIRWVSGAEAGTLYEGTA